MLSAITHATLHNVLFKGSVHLERLAGVSAIAVDKTGTVARPPRVVAIADSAGGDGAEGAPPRGVGGGQASTITGARS